MEHFTGFSTLNPSKLSVLDMQRKIRLKRQKEQRKLEAMVSARFQNGQFNMGSDLLILKQSNVLDQLVVDEMKLNELYHKYYKDQRLD